MISNTLKTYVESCVANANSIDSERKDKLQTLIDFISEKKDADICNLIFICTHNSRRSHLSQVWAQVASHYYGFHQVFCYSGGTEATELFHSSATALEQAGLAINKLSSTHNPVYSIKYAENRPAIIGFSKTYSDLFNPQSDFGAVMTCNNADQNCPIIPNCGARISLPYFDPKEFDNTPMQEGKYAERSFEIATEMFYVFSKIKYRLK